MQDKKDKKKKTEKEIKVRDLKPRKNAKGGALIWGSHSPQGTTGTTGSH